MSGSHQSPEASVEKGLPPCPILPKKWTSSSSSCPILPNKRLGQVTALLRKLSFPSCQSWGWTRRSVKSLLNRGLTCGRGLLHSFRRKSEYPQVEVQSELQQVKCLSHELLSSKVGIFDKIGLQTPCSSHHPRTGIKILSTAFLQSPPLSPAKQEGRTPSKVNPDSSHSQCHLSHPLRGGCAWCASPLCTLVHAPTRGQPSRRG